MLAQHRVALARWLAIRTAFSHYQFFSGGAVRAEYEGHMLQVPRPSMPFTVKASSILKPALQQLKMLRRTCSQHNTALQISESMAQAR